MRLVRITALCLIVVTATLGADAENDWRRVEQFARGELVAVTTHANMRIRGQLIRADDNSILLYSPTVHSVKLKPVGQLIRHDIRLLEDVDRTPLLLQDAGLLIGADGIRRNGVLIAEFSEVFSVVARAHVVSVVQPKEDRAPYGATIAGAVIGGGAGFLGAFYIAVGDAPCQPHCLARPAGVLLGGVALGGLIGHKLGKPANDLVIYRK
jgi:hypothetical protein